MEQQNKQGKRIFLVSPSPSTFTERDLEALRQEYYVREAVISNYQGRNDLKRSLLIMFEILRGVLWADLTYSWFAHNHSYLAVMLAKLLGKRTIVVIGGYEVAREPKIGYGALLDQKFPKMVNSSSGTPTTSSRCRSSTGGRSEVGDRRHVAVVYNGIDHSSPRERRNVTLSSQYARSTKPLRSRAPIRSSTPRLPTPVRHRQPRSDGIIEALRRMPANVEIVSPSSQGTPAGYPGNILPALLPRIVRGRLPRRCPGVCPW